MGRVCPHISYVPVAPLDPVSQYSSCAIRLEGIGAKSTAMDIMTDHYKAPNSLVINESQMMAHKTRHSESQLTGLNSGRNLGYE